jgi:two-component system, OmpR family, KDP operon response regulator KdpE
MKTTRILVVDDEPRLVRLVAANLKSVGFEVASAGDGKTAIEKVGTEDPDLVILDVMMPGLDGFQVLARIREFSVVPVIMLTARDDQQDKVTGLDLGADDYLTKPFGVDELLARVRALLRRAGQPDSTRVQTELECGEIQIDFSQRQVRVRDKPIRLTPTEYKLLYQLACNVDRILLYEDLLARVWGPQYRDETEYLRVYIRHLRQKIETDPARPRYLINRPGIGYVLKRPGPAS